MGTGRWMSAVYCREATREYGVLGFSPAGGSSPNGIALQGRLILG